MKSAALSLLALLAASTTHARFTEKYEIDQVILYPEEANNRLYDVEIEPGTILRVTEEEKWDLKRSGINFMDVTDYPDLRSDEDINTSAASATFPSKLANQKTLKPLMKILSTLEMRNHLEKFTSFHTRYYKSDYGRQSSEWLLETIKQTISDAGASKTVSAIPFSHPWEQSSIIVTIPGQKNSTVVIGAHQDSTNLFFPSFLAAPGADDDGSGTVTNLEALRVLLEDKDAVKGKLENTIEFHWYSAEEGGLLGSQAIFSAYKSEGIDVRAMLQQDMTGYIQKTVESGEPVSIGVMTDYVNAPLTKFIKTVIDEYCAIPYVETSCGYACSDHASADKAGYPSSFVTESTMDLSNKNIHGTGDTIDKLDFDHMLEHAKLALGFVYELAAADLD